MGGLQSSYVTLSLPLNDNLHRNFTVACCQSGPRRMVLVELPMMTTLFLQNKVPDRDQIGTTLFEIGTK